MLLDDGRPLPEHELISPAMVTVTKGTVYVPVIDFSLSEPARDGVEQVSVLTDVFSKFLQVTPTCDQQAARVAD